MIIGFRCRATEELFITGRSRKFGAITAKAKRLLDMLQYATTLQQLAVPPGNRLAMLRGNRSGQHSIRINDQWRICFIWTPDGPTAIEIVDYH